MTWPQSIDKHPRAITYASLEDLAGGTWRKNGVRCGLVGSKNASIGLLDGDGSDDDEPSWWPASALAELVAVESAATEADDDELVEFVLHVVEVLRLDCV